MPELSDNVSDILTENNNSSIRMNPEWNPAADGRKRYYVVDYFVIVDFAIYDRYSL